LDEIDRELGARGARSGARLCDAAGVFGRGDLFAAVIAGAARERARDVGSAQHRFVDGLQGAIGRASVARPAVAVVTRLAGFDLAVSADRAAGLGAEDGDLLRVGTAAAVVDAELDGLRAGVFA